MSRLSQSWARFVRMGTSSALSESDARDIRISNVVAVFLCTASTAFYVSTNLVSPRDNYFVYVLPLFFVGVAALVLNRFNLVLSSRILLCLAFPYYILLASTLVKFDGSITELRYVSGRIAILAGGLFPVSLFSTHSRLPLLLSMVGTMMCLVIYNPLHNVLNLGYFQLGFTDQTYYDTDILFVITYGIILATAFALKRNMERSETEKAEAFDRLRRNNLDLVAANNEVTLKNQEVIAQNEEIISQNEHITAQEQILRSVNEQLTRANAMIDLQRQALELQNKNLAKLLSDSDRNLVQVNQELMKHNNELQQFSYTVSHHLRGPVARLLGLTNLMVHNPTDPTIINYIRTSADELDQTLRDLTQIIDIRNEVYAVRERVSFQEQLDKVAASLKDHMPKDAVVEADFTQAQSIITIQPVLHSVLFQLISNAIKFRSDSRPLEVHIHSFWKGEEIVLEVSDNGIGMDAELYKEDMFKMYRTFHTRLAGKGLGLYLVKTQLTIIGARIEVQSVIDKGTTFTVYFTPPANGETHVCFSNEYGMLKYLAPFAAFELSATDIGNSDTLKEVMLRCGEFVKQYKSSVFIADFGRYSHFAQTDEVWMLDNMLPVAIDARLKAIFLVSTEAVSPMSAHMEDIVRGSGIEVYVVRSSAEALRLLGVLVS